MKRVVIGYVAGMISTLLVVVALMFTGTPFRSMPLKYGVEEGKGFVSTPKFLLVFEGIKLDQAGALNFTYAGRHGEIPAFWRGYGIGYNAGATGIDCLHTYEPGFGTATLFVFGKIIRVENEGKYLRVQDKLFDMEHTRIVATIDEQGHCGQLAGDDARKTAESLKPWYREGELGARPLPDR